MQCHIWNCHIYCYSWQLLLLRNQEKWVLLIFSLGILLKRRINFCTFVIFEKMYFQVKCCVICVLERLTAVDWIKSAFLYLTLFRLAFVWFVATLQYYLGKVVHLSSGCCFNKATFIRYFPICPDNIWDNIEHFILFHLKYFIVNLLQIVLKHVFYGQRSFAVNTYCQWQINDLLITYELRVT